MNQLSAVQDVRRFARNASRLVVIVDGDPGVLQVLDSCLEESGCQALKARCGAEALSLLRKGYNPSLLLTDLDTPGMSGYDLAAHWMAALPHSPVLYMSGRFGVDQTPPGIPVSDFFRKPIDTRLLRDRVSRLLSALPRSA